MLKKEKILDQKKFWSKIFLVKQYFQRLKLCMVVVNLTGCIQNFGPLEPLLLVELEFLWGGWWCKVIIVSNQAQC